MNDEEVQLTEHPLSLLHDPKAFLAWQTEVGQERAGRELTEATRRHMTEHGTRSVLDVVQKMDDVIAVLAEHTPDWGEE